MKEFVENEGGGKFPLFKVHSKFLLSLFAIYITAPPTSFFRAFVCSLICSIVYLLIRSALCLFFSFVFINLLIRLSLPQSPQYVSLFKIQIRDDWRHIISFI